MANKTDKRSIIGLKDLRENAEKYITAVGRGRSFTVVRRSRPVFCLTPADPWGDEGLWETVADFRDIDRRGFPLAHALRALKKLNGPR